MWSWDSWNELKAMTGVGDNGMWRINKAFLNQQIAAGKDFILSNDPSSDGGYYFAREVAYLTKKGIKYVLLVSALHVNRQTEVIHGIKHKKVRL